MNAFNAKISTHYSPSYREDARFPHIVRAPKVATSYVVKPLVKDKNGNRYSREIGLCKESREVVNSFTLLKDAEMDWLRAGCPMDSEGCPILN